MSDSIIRSYNGIEISQRPDGYLNLTKMAQAVNKRVNNYLRLDSTDEYLKALESDTRISATALLQVFRGFNREQGTYAHPCTL